MQLFDDLEDFGSFDDAVSGDVRDPYSELAERRREGAVQRLDLSGMPMADDAKPIFMVYGYDEVAQVLRDNETFSSSIVLAVFGDVLGKKVMLGMDEPEHRRLRALLSGAFTQRAIGRRRHDLVEPVADALIDRFADRGRAELTREFTFPFPTQIIANLLGLPPGDYPQFQKWSISILAFTVNRERALAASEALREYFTPILAARRAEPRDDLISSLAHAELDGEKLDDEEIFSFLRLLLPAGIETTYRSTGNLLFGLLSHPDQLDAVRADRSLIPQALEEAVRWEPPLLTITRVATRDAKLGGESIPAGSTVMPYLGAANRDERRWERPDRFDTSATAWAYTSVSACTWPGSR
jgi:cytochrome P450